MSLASESKEQSEQQEATCGSKYSWTPKAEEKLRELHVLQQGNWKAISAILEGPTPLECMYKWSHLHPDQAPSRQLWSQEEDEQLKELVSKFGKKWSKICTVMNWRTGKQVRERYLNQLQGTINQEKWTEDEDKLIIKLYKKFGTKWSYISGFLNGRPENMVKNRFYANLKRRYQCDLGDSDDDDFEEDDSLNSQSRLKNKKKMRKRSFRPSREISRLKKARIEENFERMTRSKITKQTEEHSQKQEIQNEDPINDNNSGMQYQTCIQSQIYNYHLHQFAAKEENQQKGESTYPVRNNSSQPQPLVILNQKQQCYFDTNSLQPQQLMNPSSNVQFTIPTPQINIQSQMQMPQQMAQNRNSQQFEIPQINAQSLQYQIGAMNAISQINSLLGLANLQAQFPQVQPQLQGQLEFIHLWRQFYMSYSNQLMQNKMQPIMDL